MIIKNYTDLGFVTNIIPPNTHLLIEASDGVLWIVDDDNAVNLYYSIDKGENWDLKDTRDDYITMAYYDRINEKIYFVDGTTADGSSSHQFYIDTSDKSLTEGHTAGAGDEMKDIVWDGTRAFSMKFVKGGAGAGTVFFFATEFDNAWADFVDTGDVHDAKGFDMTPGVVIGGFDYFLYWHEDLDYVKLYKYEVAADGWTDLIHSAANIKLPVNKSQQGIAYDGVDLLYFVLEDTNDSKFYLYTYSIGGDTLTKLGEYNIALMLDRNTAAGVLEKAFHLTEYKVYQIHSTLSQQLYLIAIPDTDAVIVAITDNFLLNDDGDMFEYEDINNYVMECIINMNKMGIWTGFISILNTYPLKKGMFIVVEDMFTTAGVSTSQIIFEGYVDTFTDRFVQTADLISPAQRDLDQEFPLGDYSGRTDEIIVDFITDYFTYVTEGTLSNGMAMGTITFAGDKSVREILDEFALQDNFIWYLTPTGVLYYNNGTVDSVENFTATSSITNVDKTFGQRAINYVDIKGGFVSGSQVSGDVAENVPDQQTNGRIPYEQTFSHLDLAAQCTTTNTNILARIGTQALIVPFRHVDPTVGAIQPGETVTFEYNITDPNIASDQFLILDNVYNAKQGKSNYRISDQVI